MANGKQIDFLMSPMMDVNGDPLSGGTVTFSRTGTGTPVNVYSDQACGTSLGATVTLDSSGVKLCFSDTTYDLRAIVKNAAGTTLYTFDGLVYQNTASSSYLLRDGTLAMTGNLNMDSKDITNCADITIVNTKGIFVKHGGTASRAAADMLTMGTAAGIFSIQASDTFRIYDDTVERARFDSSGRFIIGATSATTTLHVEGTATVTGALTCGSISGTPVFSTDVTFNADIFGNGCSNAGTGTTNVCLGKTNVVGKAAVANDYIAVVGGTGNTAEANYSAIIGGYNSTIYNGATAAFILSQGGSITDGSTYAAIVGGSSCTITQGSTAFIAGSTSCSVSNSSPGQTTSCNGIIASQSSSIVGDNSAARNFSAIIGGYSSDIATSSYSFIIGGTSNHITASTGGSGIIGSGITLNANRSYVIGNGTVTITAANSIFLWPVEPTTQAGQVIIGNSTAITNGKLSVHTGHASMLGVCVKAFAAQTANLFECYNSGNVSLISISAAGALTCTQTLTMSGATIAMGAQKITGIADGAAATDACAYGQLTTHAALTGSSAHGLGTGSLLATDTDGTLAANSDTKVATQKATKTYVDTTTGALTQLTMNHQAVTIVGVDAGAEGNLTPTANTKMVFAHITAIDTVGANAALSAFISINLVDGTLMTNYMGSDLTEGTNVAITLTAAYQTIITLAGGSLIQVKYTGGVIYYNVDANGVAETCTCHIIHNNLILA